MAMQEDLIDAAKNFRQQLTAGIKPDVGALVLLAHREGIGMNSNIPSEKLIPMLEALVSRLKLGAGNEGLIIPVGRC